MLTSHQVGLVRGRDGVSAPRGLALHSRNQPKNEALEAFIAAEAAKPFAWGVTDCCSTADRWIQIRRGVSPISSDEWDGSRGGAMDCIRHPFALPARVNRALRKAGFKRTNEPQAGDLGLVIFAGRMCIAIHIGSIWFSRHEDGLVGAPLENVWKAWAI